MRLLLFEHSVIAILVDIKPDFAYLYEVCPNKLILSSIFKDQEQSKKPALKPLLLEVLFHRIKRQTLSLAHVRSSGEHQAGSSHPNPENQKSH
jgi:hypothetical protein